MEHYLEEPDPDEDAARFARGLRNGIKYGLPIWIAIILLGMWLGGAFAHTAASGTWTYPPGCCRSAAEPGGDCAVIDDRYVVSRPDGYHLNIPKGAHPKLIDRGYSGVVPYAKVKPSPDGFTHACISWNGGMLFCFFKDPPGV
jgi:hypothetical protein